MKILLLATAIAAMPLVALSVTKPKTATAEMHGPDGTKHGTVTLTQMKGTVLVHAELKDVPEGAHGFHIHEKGTCEPDFDAAGGHYNPDGTDHGFAGGGPHAGDMANIFAGADGLVVADVFNPRVSLERGAAGTLFDADGSAIIVHEKADSYGKDAGAGGRIACGVIK